MTRRLVGLLQILVAVPTMLVGFWLMKPSPEAGSQSSEECEESAYLDREAPRLVRCYPRGENLDVADWYPLYAGAEPKEELVDSRAPVLTIDPAFPIEQSIDVKDARGVPLRVRLRVLPGTPRRGLCAEAPGPGDEVVRAFLFVDNLDRTYGALMPKLTLQGRASDKHPLHIEAYDDGQESYCISTIEAGRPVDPGISELFPISVSRAENDPSSSLSVLVGEHSDQRLEVTVPKSRSAG